MSCKSVKTRINLIIEGKIAKFECDSTNHICIEVDTITRDLWNEQITASIQTIENECVTYNGECIIRVKPNGNLEVKKI